LRQWRTWTHQEPALRGLSWHQFVVDLATGDPGRQDELLAALVRVARRDPDASGVVVGALAPGIRARIARYAPGLGREDAWSIAGIGLCAAITVDPVPERFVASQLLDAAKRQLQHAVRPEATWQDHAHPLTDDNDSGQEDHLTGPLLLGTAVAAGVISGPDAWLLHVTVIMGHSLRWASRRLGISYEAAKKRRQRAQNRWRDWWTETRDPRSVSQDREDGAGHPRRRDAAA
jgi:hypothetical protein